MHDVGKVAIPKSIINKPGRLDPNEFELIKTHTIEGQRMLDRVGGFMSDVGSSCAASHERWDGGGYPDGLAGVEIPLEARIITCCDSYNAMTTNRSYRAGDVAPRPRWPSCAAAPARSSIPRSSQRRWPRSTASSLATTGYAGASSPTSASLARR